MNTVNPYTSTQYQLVKEKNRARNHKFTVWINTIVAGIFSGLIIYGFVMSMWDHIKGYKELIIAIIVLAILSIVPISIIGLHFGKRWPKWPLFIFYVFIIYSMTIAEFKNNPRNFDGNIAYLFGKLAIFFMVMICMLSLFRSKLFIKPDDNEVEYVT